MVRFIYLTDTHIGADPVGYHQQPAYPGKIDQLIEALHLKIKQESIDFIIHGGDLVDYCQPHLIQSTAKLFEQLSVPMYLCLGNHDLDRTDALNVWLEYTPNLFIYDTPDYEIVTDTCVIHVVPNHWNPDRNFYWKETGVQHPRFTNSQLTQLTTNINKNPDKAHVLVTHNPIYGMDTDQSDLPETLHNVPDSFQRTVEDLLHRHHNLHLVLSGHSHFNTIKQTKQAVLVNGSSFVETPFEYKIIEVTDNDFQVETHRLNLTNPGFKPEYNQNRACVQGRDCDRNIKKHF